MKAIIELVALSFYKDFCCPDIGCRLKSAPLYQLLLHFVKGNTLLRDLVLNGEHKEVWGAGDENRGPPISYRNEAAAQACRVGG